MTLEKRMTLNVIDKTKLREWLEKIMNTTASQEVLYFSDELALKLDAGDFDADNS